MVKSKIKKSKAKKKLTPKIKTDIAVIIRVLNKKKKLLTEITDCEKRAFEYIEKGFKVEGYSIVEKLGNRAWAKGVTVAKLKKVFGKIITNSSDYEATTLKSVAQIEKYFKELPDEKKKLGKFTERATSEALADITA